MNVSPPRSTPPPLGHPATHPLLHPLAHPAVHPFVHSFVHLMAEGSGLSAEDTHSRYVDEFKSADRAENIAPLAAIDRANTQHWATIRAVLAINAVIMLGIFLLAAIASIELV